MKADSPPFRKRLKLYSRVNWYKTLKFNFRKFPFSIARRLPVVFYGSVRFGDLSGEVILEGPVRMGMVGFGQQFEKFTRSRGVAEFTLSGTLVFKGYCHMGKDCRFSVGRGAYCEFGDMSALGSNVKLICTERIVLGDWTGIGFESQLIDTNAHPMKNTKTGEVYPMKGPIELGSYNAVSNRVSFMPNCKTPDYCVIASNSLCNKDYRGLGERILIGGVPAKLIKEDYARDWESEKEVLKRNKIARF